MAQKVLCVGETVTDLIVYPVDETEQNTDYHKIDYLSILPGGDSHNNAVDLARLGNEVTYIGRIGRDMFGKVCMDSLIKEHINTDHIVYSDTAGQSVCLILINKNKKRIFYQMFKASEEFCYEDIDLNVLDQVDVLQISGTFHMKKFDGEGALRLLKQAKERHIITSMDVSMDRSGRWGKLIGNCYPYLDYFMPSIEQAIELTQRSTLRGMAEFLLMRGVGNVIIKSGDKGAYFLNASETIHCGCYNVDLVDATGAGDAFVAGFLTALGKGFTNRECMAFATACSAQVIQKVGATTGMAGFDDVMDFIKEHGLPEICIEK